MRKWKSGNNKHDGEFRFGIAKGLRFYIPSILTDRKTARTGNQADNLGHDYFQSNVTSYLYSQTGSRKQIDQFIWYWLALNYSTNSEFYFGQHQSGSNQVCHFFLFASLQRVCSTDRWVIAAIRSLVRVPEFQFMFDKFLISFQNKSHQPKFGRVEWFQSFDSHFRLANWLPKLASRFFWPVFFFTMSVTV